MCLCVCVFVCLIFCVWCEVCVCVFVCLIYVCGVSGVRDVCLSERVICNMVL